MTSATSRLDSTSLYSLVDLLRERGIVVLAGAGCSTESGIPDYRGPEGSLRKRKPIQYNEFVRDEATRARYWARSSIGWPRMEDARPNPAHESLARLEADGAITGIITQNVDGLHHKAGSRRVLELHGSLARVRCLACGDRVARTEFQERLLDANPDWIARVADTDERSAETAPDGDAEVPGAALAAFVVPPCDACGGVLKPDVVFFGENVPAAIVTEAFDMLAEGNVLLVLGSSLTVYSGRRFLYRAWETGIPIGVVNLGPTRADEMALAKVNGRLGEVLPRLMEALLKGTA